MHHVASVSLHLEVVDVLVLDRNVHSASCERSTFLEATHPVCTSVSAIRDMHVDRLAAMVSSSYSVVPVAT